MTLSMFGATLRPIPGALWREIKTFRVTDSRAREALQPVASVLLAVAAAAILNLDDLSWAAFSGFMVMRGSLAESIPRGIMRIAGTTMGALLGLALAPTAADSPMLFMLCLLAVSALGIFQSLATDFSYAWLFCGLTSGMVLTESIASPDAVVHFAATRMAEVTLGTCACLFVAALMAQRGTMAPLLREKRIWAGGWRELADGSWWQSHQPLLVHALRGGVAVALLPLVWREFSIQDFSQTAITSYVVMIVPPAHVRSRRHESLFERMAHRTLGCLFGSAFALLSIHLFGTDLAALAVVVAVGVWVGYSVQIGKEGVGYIGTQFTLGLLITLIQGPRPFVDATPGLDRLIGIVIGSAILCFLMLVWPLPAADEAKRDLS